MLQRIKLSMIELVVAFRRSLRLVALAFVFDGHRSLSLLRLPQSHNTAQGGMLTRITPAIIGTHHSHRHHRHIARASQARGFADAQASFAPNAAPGDTASYGGFGAPNRGDRNAPFPAHRARVALGARRGADAGARHCRRPGQHRTLTPALPPRLRRVVHAHPASSPRRAAISAAIRPAAAGCGARGS